MGGGGKGGGSKTPDPVQTANAQGQANKDAAIATAQINMIDQTGPYGSVKYSQIPSTGPRYNDAAYNQAMQSYNTALQNYNTQIKNQRGQGGSNSVAPTAPKYSDFLINKGDVPRYEQITTLDPSQQRQLDMTNQINEMALGTGKSLFSNIDAATANRFQIQGEPALPTDFSGDRSRIEGELYNRAMSRLEPQFERDRNALENKLVNQGLTRGSEAFDEALKQNEYGVNDARNSAMQSAIQQAGNEQSRLFGLSMQGRQQGIQEDLLERNQPINEVATLLGLGGNIQTPQFSSPSQVSIQPADIQENTWNAYNARQQQAAQQGQAVGNMLGLAGTLGSAAILSDRSYKRNIRPIGQWHNGLTVYEYTYKHDPFDEIHVGFMADEVKEIHPEAVITIMGVDHVKYDEAMK